MKTLKQNIWTIVFAFITIAIIVVSIMLGN